ncbi:FAD-binding and (Fe-S)-binding domain-containing protein [Terriglobus sp.]|uniref:FAD-binding and (Fe-S)-binding domain-containing protein n=1 Tax=Terriglobus sp. TaxID=1889013 RepID=UPI003AFF9DD1
MPPAPAVVSSSLAEEIAGALQSATGAEVRFDDASRALYASDLSHYRQVPVGVVVPRTVEDVIATVEVCRHYAVPILGRGAGTSLAGQTCNVAVVLDFSKYLNRLQELNPKQRYAWVEPGLINDQLRSAAEKHGLTFAPDPATHEYCTIGGMIGNNSCGPHSVLDGKTSENIEELDILLYDGTRMTVGATTEKELKQIIAEGGRRGQIYAALRDLRDAYAKEIQSEFPNIPRRVSGYNLDYLLPENGFHVARALVGTESTCAMVLRAKTKLIHSPQHRVLLLLAYPSIFDAGDASPRLSELGPIAIEGFQKRVIDNEHLKGKELPGMKFFDKGDAWLLVEFGADSKDEALAMGHKALRWAERHDHKQVKAQLLEDEHDQKSAMEVRELGLGATRVPGVTPDTYTGWEDAAVPPEKLGSYLRDFYALCDRYGYFVVLYGHFGQGCMHARMNFGMRTEEGVAKYRSFVTDAAKLVVSYGGSLSGEHGDGQARAELLPIMFGPRLIEAFAKFKRIWDPAGKMNPGKVVDPYPLDSNLRTGPDYKPLALPTIFQFPDDHGSMAEATERCFGVGKCRKLDGGTMCPSFHVTREEKHSTRGRARLLFEMLRGETIPAGWKDEGIKDALDLCLACKGCKGDCPVSVDLATYKSEFLAHYYEGRMRPAAAYSMGYIDRFAAVGSRMPKLANIAMRTPGLSAITKRVAGVTQHRQMPAFPEQSFKHWLASHPPRTAKTVKGDVILWADTFNNYFMPHTTQAALAVLQDAGYRVRVPMQHLCCGRPLYDFGMLDQAKQYLRNVMAALAEDIARGTPIVCLEPSCASVFRDELRNLFPNEEAARKLSKSVVLLPDLLVRSGYAPAKLLVSAGKNKQPPKALVHGHCHHKALWSMNPEEKLVSNAGLQAEVLDSGCCGLAGSFGYEREHYDVSMQIGESVLLPKIRSAERSTVIVADGFSCRQQIAHGTRRKAMHTAEVLHMALQSQEQPVQRSNKAYAETGHVQPEPKLPWLPLLIGATLAGGATYLLKQTIARSHKSATN